MAAVRTPSAALGDRPHQETTGPFMTIDQGSNQLHYIKPPYKAHVQLSLDRGARSGMDASARRSGSTSKLNLSGSTSKLNLMKIPDSIATAHTRRARAATAAPAKRNPNSDRPRQETIGAFMTIDKGSNMLHYMQPPYAAHVQLSLDRGARSGMDTRSRRRAHY